MSLDLYIYSKTPVLHRGTGVYVRKDGETMELKTKQEVLTHFPDVNPDDVEERTYEDNEYFHMNLTHNLTEMADKCKIEGNCVHNIGKDSVSLYDLLWHPKDNLNIEVPTLDYLECVMACYKSLLKNSAHFKEYNPKNGWGSYEQLVKRTKQYIVALQSISDDFENYTIVADT